MILRHRTVLDHHRNHARSLHHPHGPAAVVTADLVSGRVRRPVGQLGTVRATTMPVGMRRASVADKSGRGSGRRRRGSALEVVLVRVADLGEGPRHLRAVVTIVLGSVARDAGNVRLQSDRECHLAA